MEKVCPLCGEHIEFHLIQYLGNRVVWRGMWRLNGHKVAARGIYCPYAELWASEATGYTEIGCSLEVK